MKLLGLFLIICTSQQKIFINSFIVIFFKNQRMIQRELKIWYYTNFENCRAQLQNDGNTYVKYRSFLISVQILAMFCRFLKYITKSENQYKKIIKYLENRKNCNLENVSHFLLLTTYLQQQIYLFKPLYTIPSVSSLSLFVQEELLLC